MDNLKEAIDKKRNIKPNSLNAYLISIKKIHNAIFGDNKEIANINFLKDETKVLEAIKDLKLTTQKNYLSAIIVSLDSMNEKGKYDNELKEYREYLETVNKSYYEQLSKNEKTDDQDSNWVSLKELRKVMNGYKADLTDRNVFKKEALTKKQFDIMQKWVVANLYVGSDDNPPIRLDYGDMAIIKNADYEKLSDDDLDENNYLVIKSRNSKFFHFADYKTKKSQGIKKIPVGRVLNSVLNIWLKFNDEPYLLVDSHGTKMTSNQLSKFIVKVFEPTGKKVNGNLIRHVYISEKFPVEKNKEKAEVASKMGHSEKTQATYAKK
ncbi:MAG: hypothetical protein H8E16_17320 [Flavobacteriales bacterium]|nr:hypothetical protein [Flavobacteriales bacterium]